MKKILTLAMVSALVLSLSVLSFATTYTSSLSISNNSTLAGATRSYTGQTHNFVGTLSSVVSYAYDDTRSRIYLDKDVWFGEDQVYNSGMISFTNIGDSSTFTSSNIPDGNYYYFFSTQNLGTNAFSCDTVTMTSN
ncbi:hypothetical protein [Fusibacter ferrireducens]|uniref:Uncharacterized protein n=1 Tax=Fusibacter ferrireducens TaxID=2785058 RepID=A0ABR9ZSB1_9FIRM|nr:hypothetical protein [Fusibacter ferrireducens]MBF4693356.1 hypothetical protein [Fusibacter ferrireducens]